MSSVERAQVKLALHEFEACRIVLVDRLAHQHRLLRNAAYQPLSRRQLPHTVVAICTVLGFTSRRRATGVTVRKPYAVSFCRMAQVAYSTRPTQIRRPNDSDDSGSCNTFACATAGLRGSWSASGAS